MNFKDLDMEFKDTNMSSLFGAQMSMWHAVLDSIARLSHVSGYLVNRPLVVLSQDAYRLMKPSQDGDIKFIVDLTLCGFICYTRKGFHV